MQWLKETGLRLGTIARSSVPMRSALVVSLALLLGGCCCFQPAGIQGTSTTMPQNFPGAPDFQGDFAPRPGPTLLGLQSTYSGTVVVTMLDRTVVEKVLPAGVLLANPVVPSSKHPVIHLIGEQREPSTLIGGVAFPIPFANGYQEMILLVPFVVRSPGTQWHSYAVRMYLDDPTGIAVEEGNRIYGYAKEPGQLAKTEASGRTTYQVKTPDGGTFWFLSEVELTGPWNPAATAPLPRWGALQQVFEMPVLGVKPADAFGPGGFRCSYWEWDFANSLLAPARSTHQVMTKFRNGMEDWVNLGSIAGAPDGVVAMRGVRWRLANPPQGCQTP